MSAIQVVDQGETAMLSLVTDVDMTLRLYKNDVTDGLTDTQVEALTEASFTEADFAGYASVSMTTAWTVTAGNPSTAARAEESFVRSSTGTAQLVYGYYVTRNSDGDLQWFEHLDAPVSVEFEDDTVKVTPTISLDDVEGHSVESGLIVATGRSAAPTGWLLCDGAAVSRTTYADLFAAIGTAYGTGDGSTTFNVPDLQQAFPLGKAASGTGAALGDTGGAIDHVHDLDSSTSHAKIHAGNNVLHHLRKTVASYNENVSATSITTASTADAFTLGTGLGGDSDTENPPFVTVNFIVKT